MILVNWEQLSPTSWKATVGGWLYLYVHLIADGSYHGSCAQLDMRSIPLGIGPLKDTCDLFAEIVKRRIERTLRELS